MSGCLVPYGMLPGNDGIKTLEFHKDLSIIDLNPFLQYRFDRRDYLFGNSDENRYEEIDSVTSYKFSMVEFYETFLGAHNFDDVINFFERHLTDETYQSEYFVNNIKNVYDHYKLVHFLFDSKKFIIFGSSNLISFVENKIPLSYYSNRNDAPSAPKGKIATPSINMKKIKKIRNKLLENDMLLLDSHKCHKLDDLTLVKVYNLPTDDLKIVRRDKNI
ncbi:MAG: hypothetical protein ABIF08_02735 [Nanoarchaeota archaeon]